jgi:hypothetical protein
LGPAVLRPIGIYVLTIDICGFSVGRKTYHLDILPSGRNFAPLKRKALLPDQMR